MKNKSSKESDFAACIMLVSCFAYSSNPHMQAICSSKMSVVSLDYTALLTRRLNFLISKILGGIIFHDLMMVI
jgi:hypothetical protein